jgi:hypothetical protein
MATLATWIPLALLVLVLAALQGHARTHAIARAAVRRLPSR